MSLAYPSVFVLILIPTVASFAQVMVPFVSDAQRFMVFAEERFIEIDDHPPARYWSMDGAVLYQGDDGGLAYFELEGRASRVVERRAVEHVEVSGERAAWTVNDTLKVLRSGAGVVVATGVERFSVSDSLVAFQDASELSVLWRGQRIPIAILDENTKELGWEQGGNAITFFDFCGNGILAYWNALHGEFLGERDDQRQRLSGLCPISAKAGDGVLAFVDGTVKLKCWDGNELVTLTDSMPSDYWVKDQVVLFLKEGKLAVIGPEGPMDVDGIVPENWKVHGDLLVYLNENRELHGVRNGKRIRFGKEAAIDGFELFGDAILYRSPLGPITIIMDGRSYRY
jgi:hypothetical protein